MATDKKAKAAKSMKGKTPTLEALLEGVRDAVDVFRALTAIHAKFDNREREGLQTLKRYAIKHATAVKEGNKPDSIALLRTTRLAENLAQSLADRFDGIMNDSFTIFEKEIGLVEKAIPDIRARDWDKIVALQKALRVQLEKPEETSYDDTIEAYNAMMAYLPAVSQEAKQIVELERGIRNHERKLKVADSILDELGDLDI